MILQLVVFALHIEDVQLAQLQSLQPGKVSLVAEHQIAAGDAPAVKHLVGDLAVPPGGVDQVLHVPAVLDLSGKDVYQTLSLGASCRIFEKKYFTFPMLLLKAMEEAGVTVSVLRDENEWKRIAVEKIWPDYYEFIGGKAVIDMIQKELGR